MRGQSRLKVGIDVPWVTSWSEEQILGVRPCPTVNGRLAICQAEHAGFGKPQYSKNHLRRQRASVLQMLCPMCGLATHQDDRWTQIARPVAAGVLRGRGLNAALPKDLPDAAIVIDAGAIAPSHLACVERSLQHCPHLKADPNVQVLRFPERWTTLALEVRATPQAPVHVLARPQRPPAAISVVSFIQLCGITDTINPNWRETAAQLV
jgi:hypothetical protein